MADSYVCSGAMMKCTMGTSPARLTVLPIRTVFLTGQPMANISDHQTMVNLAPFGLCRSLAFPATASATAAALGTLTPMPCMHNTPFPWMGGKMDYLVKGQPALLKSSKCQCMWGGTISLVTDGQAPTGPADMSKKVREEFAKNQSKDVLSRDGSFSDKFDKAVENWKAGYGIVDSIKKANHDVNLEDFKKSRNAEGYMSDDDADLRHSNVNFGKNGQFGINCATTTTTFMLRKRGYDVTAKAKNANGHTKSIAIKLNLYDAWKNPDGSDVVPTMLSDKFNEKIEAKRFQEELRILNNTKKELLEIQESLDSIWVSASKKDSLRERVKELNPIYTESRKKLAPVYKEVIEEACEEEGYYTFGLIWDEVNYGGGHYTVLKSEKDENGNTVISNIEPQTGEPFESLDDMIDYLGYPPDPYDTLLRMDDKVFNEDYIDLFEINT